MDSMSWSLLTYAAWNAARYAAGSAAWNAANDAANDAAMAAWDANTFGIFAWDAALIAARNAARSALVVTGDDIIKMVHVLGITDPQNVGDKCYQIAECKSLLAINKELCLTIMAITEKYNLSKSILPKEKLAELRDNPWIQQYVELYPGHST